MIYTATENQIRLIYFGSDLSTATATTKSNFIQVVNRLKYSKLVTLPAKICHTFITLQEVYKKLRFNFIRLSIYYIHRLFFGTEIYVS